MEVYLVGGAVRDQLLGKFVHERDYVVVGARPEDMLAQGFRQVGKDFPVFLHPQTGEEYALARTERKSGAGYTGFTIYAAPDVTLEDDLIRRDLTINAIAQSADGKLIDPYGGVNDLKAKTLRHVSSAFAEDPLRILRVARFAARFASDGFTVASDTLQLMRKISHSGELKTLAAERVWRETEKAMATGSPHVFWQVLQQSEAFEPWYHELKSNININQLKSYIAEVETAATPSLAWALSCYSLSVTELAKLHERLKVPNNYADIAMAARKLNWKKTEKVDASWAFHAISKVDGWRRPNIVHELLFIWQALGMVQADIERVQRAFAQAQQVKAGDVIATAQQNGNELKGPAIGEAVSAARLTAMRHCWSQT
ncbi:hypothetical protein CWI82_08425 [Pseudidiomarina tainanensis]|uniref:Uncharacterized protein n=1 Tax=Pseudidiomarina tainanensis TaxID=502365 RepID=A0ACD2HL00_9GAMM|nr:hypothetical protein [Pseudidiomarina tainanensis]RZQ57271.1 hypothetical protein CWI82_08425 [Pseudidiomarina tainanensis]